MTSKLSFGIDISFHDAWRCVWRFYTILRSRRLRWSFKNPYTLSGILLLFYLIESIKFRYLSRHFITGTVRNSTASTRLALPRNAPQTREQEDITAEPTVEDSTTAIALRNQDSSTQSCNMLHSPIHLHDVDESLYIDSVSDIARKMNGVATFIKNEYCTGIQAETIPTRKLFGELVDRLLNYGWPLVSADTQDRLDLPGDKNVFDAREAVLAMECLAEFFEKRAIGVLREVELSKDLTFAARYTEALLDALPGEDGPAVTSKEDIATEEGHHEPLLELDMLEAGPSKDPTASTQPRVDEEVTESTPPTSAQLRSVKKSLSFKGPYVVENVTWQPALETVDEDALSTISTLDLEAGHVISVSDDEESLRYQAPTKEDLAPDFPSGLQGRRHSSRTWFEDDARFAELIGEIKQWQDANPDYDYTIISGGRNNNNIEDFRHHYCDAKSLGKPALFIIQFVHPLDPAVMRHVDIDVLRFIRLALWDWTNGHAERREERESLEIVRREIRARKREVASEAQGEVERRAGSQHGSDEGSWEVLSNNEETDGLDALANNLQRGQVRQSFQTAYSEIDLEDSDAGFSLAWLDRNGQAADDEHSSIETKRASHNTQAVNPNKVDSNYDGDTFTTLRLKPILGAAGVQASPRGSTGIVSPSLAQTERIARLEWENTILKARLSELEQEFESLRPFDVPSPRSRTDDHHAHPLQYLVGQCERPRSPSMQVEVDSIREDEDDVELDDDRKRYTRNDLISMLEFLKSEPPPNPPSLGADGSDDGSKGKWSHTFNDVFSRMRRPARGSSIRPTVYEGEYGAPHVHVPARVPRSSGTPRADVPSRALRSSRGRARVQVPGREISGGEDPLHSAYIWPQPGGMSMKEI